MSKHLNKKIIFSFLSGTIFTILIFYFVFRNIPFKEFKASLSEINYFWVLPSLALSFLCLLLRFKRWVDLIVHPSPVPKGTAYHSFMIGFFLNCILPARPGEFVRPYMLSAKSDISFPKAFAAVVSERFFDLMTLSISFILFYLLISVDKTRVLTFNGFNISYDILYRLMGKFMFLLIIFIVIMILLSINSTRKYLVEIIILIPEKFHLPFKPFWQKRIFSPSGKFIDNFGKGFGIVKRKIFFSKIFCFSIFIWSTQAFSYYLFALGCKSLSVSFFQIYFVMVITCFAVAIPSIPGFWGVWEAGSIFGLTLFNVPYNHALAYSLVNHVIQLIPILILGLISSIYTGNNIKISNFFNKQ